MRFVSPTLTTEYDHTSATMAVALAELRNLAVTERQSWTRQGMDYSQLVSEWSEFASPLAAA